MKRYFKRLLLAILNKDYRVGGAYNTDDLSPEFKKSIESINRNLNRK